MKNLKSAFWSLAFLLSLVFLAAAYYVTSPSTRTAVDSRAPWVAGYLRPYVRGSVEVVQSAPPARQEPMPQPAATPEPSTTPGAPPPPAPPAPFDLKKLAADRSAWPAKIAIIKPTIFPAITNGKVVGSLTAPAGTEVGLVTISGGKLGVEYQGGGAWLFVDETDLVARTQRH